MSIEKIRFEDMPRMGKKGIIADEFNAVRDLSPGEAVLFPCRWPHHRSTCGGAVTARTAAGRKGFKVRATCRDGVVYVGRPPEGS